MLAHFVCLCANVLAAQLMLFAQDEVNRRSYDMIEIGMPLKKVKTILLVRAEDMAELKDTPLRVPRECLQSRQLGLFEHRDDDNMLGRRWIWSGMDTLVLVRVDAGNNVTDKMFIRMKPLALLLRIQDALVR